MTDSPLRNVVLDSPDYLMIFAFRLTSKAKKFCSEIVLYIFFSALSTEKSQNALHQSKCTLNQVD